MHMTSAQLCHIHYGHGSGRRHSNDQPDERGKREASERADLKPEGMAGLKITDGSEGQEKDGGRGGRQHDQGNVDYAVQFLAAAAMLAGGEMNLVVPPHLGSEAGDIVSPSRKDFPYDRFNTLAHMRLQPDGRHGFSLGSQ